VSGPEVTQADRDAAYSIMPFLCAPTFELEMRQAFARHREQSTAPLEAQIAVLEAQCEALAGALEPFADCCQYISDDEDDEEWAKFRLIISDYRRARAAFAQHKGDA
jgi:hypothetical protein